MKAAKKKEAARQSASRRSQRRKQARSALHCWRQRGQAERGEARGSIQPRCEHTPRRESSAARRLRARRVYGKGAAAATRYASAPVVASMFCARAFMLLCKSLWRVVMLRWRALLWCVTREVARRYARTKEAIQEIGGAKSYETVVAHLSMPRDTSAPLVR